MFAHGIYIYIYPNRLNTTSKPNIYSWKRRGIILGLLLRSADASWSPVPYLPIVIYRYLRNLGESERLKGDLVHDRREFSWDGKKNERVERVHNYRAI